MKTIPEPTRYPRPETGADAPEPAGSAETMGWREGLNKGLQEDASTLHDLASAVKERASTGFSDAKEALSSNLPLEQLFANRGERPVWQEHRPWHARYRIYILIGLAVVLFSFVIVSNRGGTKAKDNPIRFPDRLGRTKGDIEALVSENIRLAGLSVRITGVDVQDELELSTLHRSSEDPLDQEPGIKAAKLGKEWVVVDVILHNVSGQTRRIGPGPFRMQTETGQLLHTTSVAIEGRLVSTDVVDEGTLRGRVIFEAPVDDADRFLIYQPQFRGKRLIVRLDS
jgi:hypothetical protein